MKIGDKVKVIDPDYAELVGNTPLLKISNYCAKKNISANIFAKLECFNPAGSAKDRIAKNIIEVAPLAFMRGRTLNNAFIILDEAQNTTSEQMLMFLTRMGFGSRCVITGDPSQSDLPKNENSGLDRALDSLKDIREIRFVFFTPQDVVRHALLEKIITAYNRNQE